MCKIIWKDYRVVTTYVTNNENKNKTCSVHHPLFHHSSSPVHCLYTPVDLCTNFIHYWMILKYLTIYGEKLNLKDPS